ncbi:hypothetical protein FIU94_06035 [Sulfitobacter sp. THAF37]|uniref:hypothetical protein n=1 Tax=Sulfitobacter sp. THAF37 TaxID=2587855 RepID=UPI0012687344|nr:hypothetical protein [Sulfitobacter sp. THAF37]QFT58381.1 hypothetical protein FIU94_06035 [Sulfitobacter sp. THAF37]
MSLSHLYSDFRNAGQNQTDAEGQEDESFEEANLAAFENGYQAGWDDATNAHQNAQQKAVSELSQTIQDMSFTYHEAFAGLSVAMRPILEAIATRLLPDVARIALSAQIVAEVATLAKDQSGAIFEITVAPDALPVMEEIAARFPKLPFRFLGDAELTGGQALIAAGQIEREINLDAVRQSIAEAVEAFFEQTERELENG